MNDLAKCDPVAAVWNDDGGQSLIGARRQTRRQWLAAATIPPVMAALPMALWAETSQRGGDASPVAHSNAQLTVHEWGTFTSLQDEKGREITGVNVDDEPVPEFVHRLPAQKGHLPLLLSPRGNFFKGLRLRRPPQYVMRLETPVLYFYPPAGVREPITLDVDVQFRGGWLSEFYPLATAQAPGLANGAGITESTVGSLSWKSVRLGVKQPGPETDEHVWLAPRRVQAAQVGLPNGEAEKYLFYRGIGAIGAPLRVMTDENSNHLHIFSNLAGAVGKADNTKLRGAWLVRIRPDGAVAFRDLGSLTAPGAAQERMATVSANFSEGDFSQGNLDSLRDAMHRTLVADGLYADEAAAMLATWEYSYFQSPGQRLFFTVPRNWTDSVLPLKLSKPANVERVMVGRIELVTPQQRTLISKIAAGPTSSHEWMTQIPKSKNRDLFYAGKPFGSLGVEIPTDYQQYLELGRFRNALLAAEDKSRPTPALSTFMRNYGVLRDTAARRAAPVRPALAKTKER